MNTLHITESGRRAIAVVAALILHVLVAVMPSKGLAQGTRIKAAYSALSAGLGTIWLAREAGIFAKEGLDVELLYIIGSAPTMQTLLSGELQFAHTSPVPVFNAASEGAEVVWLGTTIRSMVFTLLALPSIQKPSDLIGKRLGLTRPGAAAEIAARMALKHLNVDAAKVHFAYVGGIPEVLIAMKAGAVQAGVVSPPTSTIGKKLGYRPLVFIPDLKQQFPFSGIASSRRYVRENPQVAKAFMKAMTEGIILYKKDPELALKVLQKYIKAYDVELLREGYNEYISAIASPPLADLVGLESVRESLLPGNPKLKTLDLRILVDDRFVRDAIR